MFPGPYTSGQGPHGPPRADPSPGALASGSAPQDSFSPHQAERRKKSVLQRFLEKPAIADGPCLSRGATSLLQRSSGEGASGEEAAGTCSRPPASPGKVLLSQNSFYLWGLASRSGTGIYEELRCGFQACGFQAYGSKTFFSISFHKKTKLFSNPRGGEISLTKWVVIIMTIRNLIQNKFKFCVKKARCDQGRTNIICIGVEEETFKLCTIFIKYLGPVLSRTLLFYYCCYPHNLLMYCRFCVFKRGLFLDFEQHAYIDVS